MLTVGSSIKDYLHTSLRGFRISALCKISHNQCGQIGHFWKLKVTNLLTKVAQKDWWLFGYLKKDHFCKKHCFYYLSNFYQHLGYLLTLTSGHTGHNLQQQYHKKWKIFHLLSSYKICLCLCCHDMVIYFPKTLLSKISLFGPWCGPVVSTQAFHSGRSTSNPTEVNLKWFSSPVWLKRQKMLGVAQ